MFSKFLFNEDAVRNLVYSISDKVQGDRITSAYKKQVKEKLAIKFIGGNIIDGSATQEDWFPQVECDIFLSHTHKDIDLAKKFAGWIKNKFNLNVFIDYNIWGNINDLLKIIDTDYCYDKIKKTYSYDKRNITTSHVHMMLINALSEMMDKTECLMFFETPNSINLKKLTHSAKTESPWIYNELFLSKIIRKEQRRKGMNLSKATDSVRMYSDLNESFIVTYDTDTSHLVDLFNEDLKNWQKILSNNTNGGHPLDILYTLKNIQ